MARGLNNNKTNPLMQNVLQTFFSKEENQNLKDLDDIAQQYLDNFISLGAYTDSQGNSFCLNNIQNSIQQRDGIEIQKDSLTITASNYILLNMIAICGNKNNQGALLMPRVVDPICTQILNNNNIKQYEYWDLGNEEELLNTIMQGIKNSKKENKRIFGLYLQSPHGITGKVYTKEIIENVMELCYDNNLMLIVDESYQLSQLPEQIISTRKVMHNHKNKNIKSNLELIAMCNSYKSLIPNQIFQGSVSTLENLDPDVKATIFKLQSMMLCCATTQQIYIDLIFQLHFSKGLFSSKYQEAYNTVIKNNASLIEMHQNQLLRTFKKFKDLRVLQSNSGHDLVVEFGTQDDVELSKELQYRSSIRSQPGSQFNLPGFLSFSKLQYYKSIHLEQLESSIADILK